MQQYLQKTYEIFLIDFLVELARFLKINFYCLKLSTSIGGVAGEGM